MKSMAGAVSSKSCGPCLPLPFGDGLASGLPMLLCQPHAIEGMHFLKLVLAGKVEDGAPGVAPHGLRPGLLEVNVAGQGCGAEQVLLPVEKKLGLVGAAVHLGVELLENCLGAAYSRADFAVLCDLRSASRW